MQLPIDPIAMVSLIGIALSLVFMMFFESSFASSKGISQVPITYSIGALVAFFVGQLYIIELETPIHSLIGFVGGYLLLSLSIIQALFDIKKTKFVNCYTLYPF